MNLDQLTLIQNAGILFLFKIGFLLTLTAIEILLFVIFTQIRSMNAIVTQPDMFPYLEAFVFFLGLSTAALFVVALVIL